MKKIYLLSALACLFAFNVNAQKNIDGQDANFNEWFTDGANAKQVKLVSMQVSTTTESFKVKNVAQIQVADTGDQWATQFCIVIGGDNALKGFEPGADFQLECDVYFKGPKKDSVSFNFLTGKLLNAQHADWQWSSDDNKELDYAGNFWGIHNASTGKFAAEEWNHFVWPAGMTKLGDAGWLGIQLNLAEKEGTNIGSFYFANVKITLGNKTHEYFNEKEDATAVEEVAAVNAYVAGDVLYASEAADVTIYNISRVAVKVAKNVTTLNVADLKAGLYIAKVGNTTTKFVK